MEGPAVGAVDDDEGTGEVGLDDAPAAEPPAPAGEVGSPPLLAAARRLAARVLPDILLDDHFLGTFRRGATAAKG